jgi:hypothetical protein
MPGEDLLDDRRFEWVDPHPARITRAFGVQEIAIGHTAPWVQLPTAQLGLAATPHAVGDQGAFILGDRPPDLKQELVVRVSTHRAIQKFDLAAALQQFTDQDHLVDIVSCQAIGCGDEHAFKGGKDGAVAQAIQARAIELGTACFSRYERVFRTVAK